MAKNPFKVGDRVWHPVRGGGRYTGTVIELQSGAVVVRADDPDPDYGDRAVWALNAGVYKLEPTLSIAVSILSDAQELLEHGRTEEVRQLINRAKDLLIKEIDVTAL
jgi:hypothetical protein